MALVDFTTFDDIRAALGVTPEELEDATLSLAVYEFNLLAELEEMEPSPLEQYLALKDNDLEGMSTAESRFFRAARLFSTYSVARHLTTALPMFGPKEVSDGKAHVTRFSTDPYKETVKRIEGEYGKQAQRLQAALATLTSATATVTTARIYFKGAAPSVDPVTGE